MISIQSEEKMQSLGLFVIEGVMLLALFSMLTMHLLARYLL